MLAESEIHDVDAFFAYQIVDNDKFWTRLGGRPDLAGKRVLDFGCGHGALSLNIAEAGAAHVLGIELSSERIAYANAKVRPKHPERLEFRVQDVTELPGQDLYDVVVSKDTFEHVNDLEGVLGALVRLLKPGGQLVLGFSPLYYSPFGDHGEFGVNVPWFHLLAGEQRVVRAFNAKNRSGFATMPDAGFNMKLPHEFWTAFTRLPLRQRFMSVNACEGGFKGVGMAAFNVLRKVPGLERYFTVGIYTVMEKLPD